MQKHLIFIFFLLSTKLFSQTEHLQWQITNINNLTLQSGKLVDFYNTDVKKNLCLKSTNRGISLGWKKKDKKPLSIKFIRKEGDGTIHQCEQLALWIEGAGFVKYEDRDYGVWLVWSSEPVFEWQLTTAQLTCHAVRPNLSYGLYNTEAERHIVHVWKVGSIPQVDFYKY